MNFTTSINTQLNIYNDLLADILAWQMTQMELKAFELSNLNGTDPEEEVRKLAENQSAHRKHIVEQLYEKYGGIPPALDDVLKTPPDDDSDD